jgi:hypothetical protein
MLFIETPCPCCGTNPVAFRSNGRMVILCCWECAACFPSPKEVGSSHMVYPDKDGNIVMNGATFCVRKESSHDATIEEVEAAGWKSAVVGKWHPTCALPLGG